MGWMSLSPADRPRASTRRTSGGSMMYGGKAVLASSRGGSEGRAPAGPVPMAGVNTAWPGGHRGWTAGGSICVAGDGISVVTRESLTESVEVWITVGGKVPGLPKAMLEAVSLPGW